MDHVILNHGQVTWTTPELVPPLLTTSPHQQEDVSASSCPTRRVFSGTGLELVTRQVTIRYLYHSATAAILPVRRTGEVAKVAQWLLSQTCTRSVISLSPEDPLDAC
ncbi:uncharacterized protein TNCV_3584851 [Trichonephila clavipes]|nr:uncharacterized protein TNCV_3584851 [Trichonephila clavipes]